MDITLVQITKEQLPDLIKLAFEGDGDLLDKYHISPGTLQHCVSRTYDFICDDIYQGDMSFFSINNGDTNIGFTVLVNNENAPNELYSFGVNKEYRKKEILLPWLNCVEEKLGIPYFTALYDRNERAVNFFLKNDFIAEQKNGYKLLIKSD